MENKVRGFALVDNFVQDAYIPKRATSKSSGYDFRSPYAFWVAPGERKTVWTGIKAYMGSDEEFLLFPRSSLGIKGIILANTVGKVDSDYYNNNKNEGNIGVCLWNTSGEPFFVGLGEKICQGSFYKYLIADNDCPASEERVGGFGSTGA